MAIPKVTGVVTTLDCIFCKIASGEVSTSPVFENDNFIAFYDLAPAAPVHVIVITKSHFTNLMELEDASLAGEALIAVQEVAKITGVDRSGFRTVINTLDDGGQTIHHLHLHVLGGRFMSWPPG